MKRSITSHLRNPNESMRPKSNGLVKRLTLGAVAALALTSSAFAQILIPGADGSDGDLTVASGAALTIDLDLAAVGPLSSTPGTGNGVYDPDRWAVVFRYDSVTIGDNATVEFTNHCSGAPVVWLVSGSVSIQGLVDLSGEGGATVPGGIERAKPGPGGFSGGAQQGFSEGLGPGGGMLSTPGGGSGGSGSYATLGHGSMFGSQVYGNPEIIPLIGGSGGVSRSFTLGGGGAGGGAILIASTETIDVGSTGEIRALGGDQSNGSRPGSGGAVRLVAHTIAGAGTIDVTGGLTTNPALKGGSGRIRVEAEIPPSMLTYFPIAAAPTLSIGSPALPPAEALIWPPSTLPTVRIVSIDSLPVPADPKATNDPATADLQVHTLAVQVLLETENVPTNGSWTVSVRAVATSAFSVTSTASWNPMTQQWEATLNLVSPNQVYHLQASARQ